MLAPSVFSKSGWVHRKLTPMEMGVAWDLPVETLASFANHQGDSSEAAEAISNISHTTSCKSLWSFGQSMLLFGLCPDDMDNDDHLKGQESTTETVRDRNS